jgi:lambda family phage holin
MSLDKNPETWIAIWSGLSEPVKAAAFSLALGALMAARQQDGRSFTKKSIEVATGALLASAVGYMCHLAGLPSWAVWGANGAVIIMGVDKVRAVVDFGVDKYIYKKEIGKDG